jgi:hypothetical protein
MKAEEVKRLMRETLGPDVNLDYITDELLADQQQNAQRADDSPEFAELGPEYTIYGNNVTQWGGVTYWYADNRNADRSQACGSYQFYSDKIKRYGYDSSCPNGKTLYWLSKL